jgi:uncharacterized protein YjbI with pentapeptide repeats
MSDPLKNLSKGLPGLKWLQGQVDSVTANKSIEAKEAIELLKVYASLFGLATTVFTGIGVAATFMGLAVTFYNTVQDRGINIQRLADERLVKSIEQLSNDKIFVRISGIYSLRGVINDSDKNKDAVNAALDSFIIIRSAEIRSSEKQQCPEKINTPKENNYLYAPPKSVVHYDLEAALIVVSSTNKDNNNNAIKYNRTCLNLSGMKLLNINLGGTDFRKSTFKNTDLSNSTLDGSLLSESSFDKSIFRGSKMNKANLTSAIGKASNFESSELKEAIFTGAVFDYGNFKKANLNGSDLERSSFKYVDFTDATLANANIEKADFLGAKISPKQILSTCNWDKANYYESNDENQKYIQSLKDKNNPYLGEKSNCANSNSNNNT